MRRKQTLRHRIAGVGAAQAQAMGQYHPAGTAATPMLMPVSQVQVSAPVAGYVTIGYRDLVPLWTADGAAVPAAVPGQWGQLRAAGRP